MDRVSEGDRRVRAPHTAPVPRPILPAARVALLVVRRDARVRDLSRAPLPPRGTRDENLRRAGRARRHRVRRHVAPRSRPLRHRPHRDRLDDWWTCRGTRRDRIHGHMDLDRQRRGVRARIRRGARGMRMLGGSPLARQRQSCCVRRDGAAPRGRDRVAPVRRRGVRLRDRRGNARACRTRTPAARPDARGRHIPARISRDRAGAGAIRRLRFGVPRARPAVAYVTGQRADRPASHRRRARTDHRAVPHRGRVATPRGGASRRSPRARHAVSLRAGSRDPDAPLLRERHRTLHGHIPRRHRRWRPRRVRAGVRAPRLSTGVAPSWRRRACRRTGRPEHVARPRCAARERRLSPDRGLKRGRIERGAGEADDHGEGRRRGPPLRAGDGRRIGVVLVSLCQAAASRLLRARSRAPGLAGLGELRHLYRAIS